MLHSEFLCARKCRFHLLFREMTSSEAVFQNNTAIIHRDMTEECGVINLMKLSPPCKHGYMVMTCTYCIDITRLFFQL